jgi:hypothetical protein
MKKMMQWVFTATLIISGLSVFSACGSDNDDENKPPVVQPDDNGANSGDDDGGLSINNQSGNGGSNELEPRTLGAEW